MRVDVAGGDAEHDRWDAAVGEVERASIGASAAADSDLVRNIGEFCGLDREFCEAGVADGAGIKKTDLHA